ncbi:MAG: hypothetical protein LBI99_08750 [Propionibacteriaceae bacterium]|jgi:hypothetical protein|nr:hypothetical protein [Propionibacteriaceae bacterium]
MRRVLSEHGQSENVEWAIWGGLVIVIPLILVQFVLFAWSHSAASAAARFGAAEAASVTGSQEDCRLAALNALGQFQALRNPEVACEIGATQVRVVVKGNSFTALDLPGFPATVEVQTIQTRERYTQR